jgi:hypothetical protein
MTIEEIKKLLEEALAGDPTPIQGARAIDRFTEAVRFLIERTEKLERALGDLVKQMDIVYASPEHQMFYAIWMTREWGYEQQLIRARETLKNHTE